TGFTDAAIVYFGMTLATDVVINSDSQITATTPASVPAIVDITVVTPGGTSAVTAADEYTYVAAPTLTGVTINDGPTVGGTKVTISGTNLAGATEVDFGSMPAGSFVIDSATEITAIVPPANSAGTVDVRVTTAGGTSAVSSGDKFLYVVLPVVTKLTPSPAQTSENFGGAVAMDGDAMVIGAPSANSDEGAAYVFIKSTAGWIQTAMLTPADGA